MRRAIIAIVVGALALAGVVGEARWLAGDAPQTDAAYYTCSMDPAVHADRPGTCPICGMALTPVAHADRASPAVWLAPEARNRIGLETAIASPRVIALPASDVREVAVAVPARAVLYVGPRRIAFVEARSGALEPRELQLGAASNGYVEVVRGLAVGDRVVVRGQFLLAAESRLRSDSALWSGRIDKLERSP